LLLPASLGGLSKGASKFSSKSPLIPLFKGGKLSPSFIKEGRDGFYYKSPSIPVVLSKISPNPSLRKRGI